MRLVTEKLLSGRRILVVEDEMLVLMSIEDMLADLGCESVTAAATVDQAVAVIDAQVAIREATSLMMLMGIETDELKPKAGSAEACGEVIVRVGDDLKVGEQSLVETLVLSKRKLYIHHCLVPFYRAASV
jgi:CheY-like chemotaxis protein